MKILLSLLLCVSGMASARSLVNIESFPGKVVVKIDPQMNVMSSPVDILFVVDNSGSMEQHQKNLALNINFLMQRLKDAGVDFHAGVTTTDMVGYSGVKGAKGELVGPIVTPSTPNMEYVLASQLKVGTMGDATEEMFAPVMLALSEPLRTTAGFYRDYADLAIVFVTDADDQGKTDAPAFAAFLRGLKHPALKITMQGLIVRSADDDKVCGRDGTDKPVKVEAAINEFGGNSFSLCDTNFAGNMRAMGEAIATSSKNKSGKIIKPGTDLSHIVLPSTPDFDSISVNYGSQKIRGGSLRTGWVYDDSMNEVQFGADVDWSLQVPGTTLDIEYVPVGWK